MLDFTSSLYLGLRHPSHALEPWQALTTGKPYAVQKPDYASGTEARLAALIGCEQAILSASTFHLFWDLFGIIAEEGSCIYVDSGCYEIARWGVERAAGRRIPIRTFPHGESGALRKMIADRHKFRPIIVTDGFCPSCGTHMPLQTYAELAIAHGGYVVVDDTQSLGVLGEVQVADPGFGAGGGGSLKHASLKSRRVIVCASLAKAFGAPLAVLAASSEIVKHFVAKASTLIHCSAPSAAAIQAARRALDVNAAYGEGWRAHVAALLLRFQAILSRCGIPVRGRMFPLLSIGPWSAEFVNSVYQRLLEQGIKTIMSRSCSSDGLNISFAVTALHDSTDIDRAGNVLGAILKRNTNYGVSYGVL